MDFISNNDSTSRREYSHLNGAEAILKNYASSDKENKSDTIQIPSITLPKGGGALKNIDEKFGVNASNGTASFSIPLPFSKTRSDFTPALSLNYNSGSGNSRFGLGWDLGLPAIQRKTDKKLPQYNDAEESDVFMFTGVEDLVPTLIKDASGNWTEQTNGGNNGETIKRYRPRIEGSFNRIERITLPDSSVFFWKVTTPQNVVTIFGRSEPARIADLQYPDHIFKWLPELSYDDKGNCFEFEYTKEDFENVPQTLFETNRLNKNQSCTNTYLKRIRYGNAVPYPVQSIDAYNPATLGNNAGYLFETVFDFTDEHLLKPNDVNTTWLCRCEPFSDYKAGFEIRTYRLCRRILFFHNFKELNDNKNAASCLVRSLDLSYKLFQNPSATPDQIRNAEADYITSIQQSGYIKVGNSYSKKSLPPIEFSYQVLTWNKTVLNVTKENMENDPVGLSQGYQWTDLWSEGISGILSEQVNGWFYKSNLGNGNFTPAVPVIPKPSFLGLSTGQLQLQDLEADGRKFIVSISPPVQGYFEISDDNEWQPFQSFDQMPNINLNDPNTKYIDLNGDGKPDLIISEENVFTWYENLGVAGYDSAELAAKPYDEEKGPAIVFADLTQSIFLADLSGDGLTDIVRIRNGEICYWPNMGYGKFGAKVNMDNAPVFDLPDQFNPSYLHLFDVSGTGATDIIYLGKNQFNTWLNLSGNAWSNVKAIDSFPSTELPNQITVVDFLGNGTGCIVWSSPLPEYAYAPMRYIDLMSSNKPYIMSGYKNNFGKEVSWNYQSSTHFYLEDKQNLQPWTTKLPFAVQCVSKTTVTDKWQNTQFSNQYSYHHGYYDHAEREFRGFGRVDQIDCETFGEFDNANANSPYITQDKTLYQPPIFTKTWFHLGAFFNRENILSQFATEYFKTDRFTENALPEPDLQNADLNAIEWREALRSCKGMMLRQEVYELDVNELEKESIITTKLFSTAYHNCHIERLQPLEENAHAVFLTTESEAITYNYELDLKEQEAQPDPRIVHTINLSIDNMGNVLESVAIAYKRTVIPSSLLVNIATGNIAEQFENNAVTGYTNYLSQDDATRLTNLLSDVQQEQHLIYTVNNFTGDINDVRNYRLRMPCETKTYEVTKVNPSSGFYFTLNDLKKANLPAVEELQYHQQATKQTPQKRIIEQARTLYFKDDLQNPEALGTLNQLGLVYEKYRLALTSDLLTDIIGGDKINSLQNAGESNDEMLSRVLVMQGGYAFIDSMWWMRSGVAGFADDAADHFYLPEKYTDAFGNITTLQFDSDYYLYLQASDDPVGNHTEVSQFDFRVLAPLSVKDMNDNETEVVYDIIGVPAAIAVKGQNNESGDELTGIETDTDEATLINFFTTDYDETQARGFLRNATIRYVYYLGETTAADETLTYGNHPACAASIAREKHVFQLADSPLQTSFQYTDGSGNIVVAKMQAEPENAGGALRWIASGKTILNNKGKPVKKYEPYFTVHQMFEEPLQMGVTPVMYYDAVGRLVRTDMPDQSYSRVEFTPWFSATFDQNDTLLEDGNVWYDTNRNSQDVNKQNVAKAATIHANTPTLSFFDSLGRDVISLAHNRWNAKGDVPKEEKYFTYTKLDAEGKPLWILDDRNNRVMQYIFPYKPDNQDETAWNPVYFPCYDIAGNLLFQHSMDGGDRWMLNDSAGKPMYAWDSRQHRFFTEYDKLHRPTNSWLYKEDTNKNILVGIEIYQDNLPGNKEPFKQNNLLGKVYQHYDQSGCITNAVYDFKGNLLTVDRALTKETKTGSQYADEFDWNTVNKSSLLEDENFEQTTQYDALNRMIQLDSWHTTKVASTYNVPANIYLPEYNERGLLKAEKLFVRGVIKDPPESNYIISGITYDAKGQKQQARYSNNTVTNYAYDANTFRLTELTTTGKIVTNDNPNEIKTLQDLSYTYDPIGNISLINDAAQQSIFFSGQKIDPNCSYEYDALYRLVHATGREHNGQNPPNDDDSSRMNCPQPNDGTQMGNYSEYYDYDSVGNILKITHFNSTDSSLIWTRQYQYDVFSNQLLGTFGADSTKPFYKEKPTDFTDAYTYNVHGSMITMPHLQTMDWDYTEHLHHIKNGTQETWYRYDAQKQRTRKITEPNGTIKRERIYLGGLEIYREWNGDTLTEQNETIQLVDASQRMILIDHISSSATLPKDTLLYRYQYSNHLSSAVLELDDKNNIISYEEYHPYGSTSYQAINSFIQSLKKRYRYTGKERDEESGFNYHSARYFICWLGRWLSTDPIFLKGGKNLYEYSNNNPILYNDKSGNQPLATFSQQSKGMSTFPLPGTIEREFKVYGPKNVILDFRDRFRKAVGDDFNLALKMVTDVVHKTRIEMDDSIEPDKYVPFFNLMNLSKETLSGLTNLTSPTGSFFNVTSMQTLFHESTHAYLDQLNKSNNEEYHKIHDEAVEYYKSGILKDNTKVTDPERVFQEAAATYVASRTDNYLNTYNEIKLQNLLFKKGKIDFETYQRKVDVIGKRYDAELSDLTQGYQEKGVFNNEQVEVKTPMPQTLKTFLDTHILGPALTNRFENNQRLQSLVLKNEKK